MDREGLTLHLRGEDGGAEGIRTPDPHNAIVVLYQLSYDPIRSGSDTVKVTNSFVKIYLPARRSLRFSPCAIKRFRVSTL